MFSKVIAAIFGGLIISTIGSVVVLWSVGVGLNYVEINASAFLVFYLISFIISIRSNSSKQAWKRLLISASILCFLLPISNILFTVIFLAEETSGAGAAGGLLAGALVTSVMGFIGFFLGIVFLIIGMLLKDEKELE